MTSMVYAMDSASPASHDVLTTPGLKFTNVFMPPVGWHIAVELSVRLSVRPKTLTLVITFAILKIAT